MDLSTREQRVMQSFLEVLRDRGAELADAVAHTEVDLRIAQAGHRSTALAEFRSVTRAAEEAGLVEARTTRLGALRWRITDLGADAITE